MNNRNNSINDATGFVLLFWIAFGLFLIPLYCVFTFLRDGEDSPGWVTTIALLTLGFCGTALVVTLLEQAHIIH